MGDNIFHVICILERIICYENPPTDKTGGGGGGAQVLKRIAQGPDSYRNAVYASLVKSHCKSKMKK